MNAEQMETLVNMRLGGYSDHQCLMQELTFKNEKLIAIEAENARLKEALRECVDVLVEKAREVLGDDPITPGK